MCDGKNNNNNESIEMVANLQSSKDLEHVRYAYVCVCVCRQRVKVNDDAIKLN